jgi:pimeloyl-ACP methyl ester carboxylesterase
MHSLHREARSGPGRPFSARWVPVDLGAIAFRGHGRSTRNEQPYGYDLMAADVTGLMDFLKIPKAAIVGWSDPR